MSSLLKMACRCVLLTALVLGVSGCLTSSYRVSRYVPRTGDRRPWTWGEAPRGVEKPVEEPVARPDETAAGRKVLKRGDRLIVYLRGIPKPDDINSEVNTLGEISLPHIGPVRVEEMTSAEAQKRIEKLYIDKKIYHSITVIIVAQEDEYFVTGEVKMPNRYPLRGEIRLRQAIAAAGGETDFANNKKVELTRRNGLTTRHSIPAIKAGKEEDPVIHPGDIITVPEHW